MTDEHYVHFVAAPGRALVAPPPANSEADSYIADGSVLFMSTRTHLLSDYIVLHSTEEFGLGLALNSWRYRGCIGANGLSIASKSLYDMVDPMYNEGFLLGRSDGYVELYFRLSGSFPRDLFALYNLNCRQPEHWWSATVWEYERHVRRPDLVARLSAEITDGPSPSQNR